MTNTTVYVNRSSNDNCVRTSPLDLGDYEFEVPAGDVESLVNDDDAYRYTVDKYTDEAVLVYTDVSGEPQVIGSN